MLRKITALLLVCAMLLLTVGCAGTGDSSKETSGADITSAPDETTEPEETTDDFYADRNNTKDSLPEQMNFGDSDIRILSYRINFDKGGSNLPEIEFFNETDGGTNIVNSAILQRNAVVEDRLKVKMVVLNEDNYYTNRDKMRTSIMAFTSDYDLYMMGNWEAAGVIKEGLVHEMSSLDYLDFDQPWWNASYIDSATIDNRIFVAAGELSLSLLGFTFVTFFNKSLWADYHGDKDLYQIVRDGNFTLDKFAELCSTLYKDLNSNGVADVEDQYGNIHPWETPSSESFTAGSHLHYIDYDEENSRYYFSFGNSRDMEFVEKLRNIWFKNNNTYTSENNEMDLDEQLIAKLKNGTALFTVDKMADVELLRDMDEDFGIVPVPKFDEAQESYYTTPSLAFTVAGIVNNTPNPDMVAAFMEAACAENYRFVTPAYFDNAVKYGYTRDVESAEMLDICVKNIYLPIEKAFCFGGYGLISSGCNTERSLNILSSYIEKHRKEWESGVNDTMAAIRAII